MFDIYDDDSFIYSCIDVMSDYYGWLNQYLSAEGTSRLSHHIIQHTNHVYKNGHSHDDHHHHLHQHHDNELLLQQQFLSSLSFMTLCFTELIESNGIIKRGKGESSFIFGNVELNDVEMNKNMNYNLPIPFEVLKRTSTLYQEILCELFVVQDNFSKFKIFKLPLIHRMSTFLNILKEHDGVYNIFSQQQQLLHNQQHQQQQQHWLTLSNFKLTLEDFFVLFLKTKESGEYDDGDNVEHHHDDDNDDPEGDYMQVSEVASSFGSQRYNKPLRQSSSLSSSLSLSSSSSSSSSSSLSPPELILYVMPFVLSTSEKVKILHHWIQSEHDVQGRGDPSVGLPVKIRRQYLLEDSFKNLNPVSNLKQYIKVEFINQEGLEEAGIGGGVFKEFITNLIKESFSPQYGYFSSTKTSDAELYPNPDIKNLYIELNPDTFYQFLGKITGKLIFEMMLTELPLTKFFIKQIFHRSISTFDLASYDNELWHNLKLLENLTDDEFSSLDLNFTVVDSTDQYPVELINGGTNIELSRENLRMYLKSMAYHKLSKNVHSIIDHFRRGLFSVIPYKWLSFFNNHEFQYLISGNSGGIDIIDLRNNTKYSNGFTENHPTVQMLWIVLSEFTPEQQAKFLKFVTSCSRPPLLGFKVLHPQFCVHKSNIENLPSATTCVNQLKLPPIDDYDVLKQKLLFAIESNSGFELS
eukprot:TRINITY_DN1247_c2_g2_i1.p1 TRINITY_DN1247_c2_g2~~TRINITY_DN1247_c2_g2_i1.p1  ORF type:complete len:721 (+),score=241.81 TRINITY_DN1247_c2_g2_i1:85-2163(+)